MGVLPFEIAIFRLLILDEAAPGYDFAISAVRFKRMLGWTFVFWAIGNVPFYLPKAVAASEAAQVVVTIPLILIFTVVMLRTVILLPAIAVDAPGASIRNVLADTRGPLRLENRGGHRTSKFSGIPGGYHHRDRSGATFHANRRSREGRYGER
jgi:hypothetical protein